MKFELFIANRLKTGKVENDKSSTPSLNVAVIGMTLAITIMILSITIVCGFKKEISNKIYNLDSHIKIVTSSINNKESEIKHITDNIDLLATNATSVKDITVAIKNLREIKGVKHDIDLKEQEARIAKLIKDAEKEEQKDTEIKVIIEGDLDKYSK
jgi:ABC-type lipoprotein release transport system permease subunit